MKSCETHELDAVLVQRICDSAFERFPISAVPGVIDGCRGNRSRLRMCQAGGIGKIGRNERDLGRI